MTKKDIAFLKKLISLNRFEKIYSDDLSMRLLGNVSFYFSEMPFDFTLSREQAVDKKYNDLIKFYQDKNNNFAQRYVDEYVFNEKFYKEKFAEQYDRLSKEILVNELPDEEGVLIILANPKKKRFLHSSVIMKEEIKKTDETYQQEKILAIRGRYAWTCNKLLTLNEKMVLSEDMTPETEDLPFPVLDLGYYPSHDDVLELCILNPKQTARFRKLKTHKFVGTSDAKSVALLINKQIAGVIGYNQVFTTFYGSFEENELFLQFSIACTPFDRRVRMGKLVDKVALWEKTAKLMLNDYEKEKYDSIVSTSITPYPECKHARRLMKLKSRKFDEKTKMYNLVYGCEMTKQKDLKEIFEDWIKKEKL